MYNKKERFPKFHFNHILLLYTMFICFMSMDEKDIYHWNFPCLFDFVMFKIYTNGKLVLDVCLLIF